MVENKKGSPFLKNFPLCTQTKTIYEPIYEGFKKLYDLKPILEEAGIYPIISNPSIAQAV